MFLSRPPSSTLWGGLLAGEASLWDAPPCRGGAGKLRAVLDQPAARVPQCTRGRPHRSVRQEHARSLLFGHSSQYEKEHACTHVCSGRFRHILQHYVIGYSLTSISKKQVKHCIPFDSLSLHAGTGDQ